MLLRPPRLALGLVACGALVVTGCSDRSAALPVASAVAAVPSIAPSPSASPSPETIRPVDGSVRLTVVHLESAGQRLHPAGSAGDQPPVVDEPAVHDFVGQVDRWLDAHLMALQQGGASPLPAPLDPASAPAAVTAVTTDLTSPDVPVSSATYDVEVGVDGTPAWAHVTVTVARRDGSTVRADFVFVPGPDGPGLIAAGPAGEVRP